MIFEFLIACRPAPDTNIQQILTDLLTEALEAYFDVSEEETIADLIQLRHERSSGEITDDDGITTYHKLIGFALELSDEIESIREVVDEFATSLPNTPPIFHVVKFEDPLLQAELADYAKEIFELEMKLRRVLSLIYLHAYQDNEATFNLLGDETVNPLGKAKPDMEHMKSAKENQFFHLTFSQYKNLNQRPELKLPDIMQSIKNTEEYDTLRAEILRVPIEHEEDAEFLASLTGLMDSIEGMRNCVAHNRRPTRSINDNYPTARLDLEKHLDEYLEKWETQQ